MPLTRLSLEERIRCVRFFSMYTKASYIQKAWRKECGTDPPSRKTIAALNKKFNETGSVADLSRSGRPKTSRSAEKVALVEAALKTDPTKSIRNLSSELGVNKAAVHRIKKEVEKKKNTLRNENRRLRDKVSALKKQIEILKNRMSSTSPLLENVELESPCNKEEEIEVELLSHTPNHTMSITIAPSNGVLNSQLLHLQPVQVVQVQQHSDITQLQTQEISQIHACQISQDSMSDCTMYHITTTNSL